MVFSIVSMVFIGKHLITAAAVAAAAAVARCRRSEMTKKVVAREKLLLKVTFFTNFKNLPFGVCVT